MRIASRIAAAAVVMLLATTWASAAAPIRTVGQWADHSAKVRVDFVYHYLRTHKDSCTGHVMPKREAHSLAETVTNTLRVGRDDADGSVIKASTLIGSGIRHIEANIGC